MQPTLPRSRRSASLPLSVEQADDAALVAAVACGDRDAIAALYDVHAQRLGALVAHILKDQTQAEDVVHDVFVEVWHHAAEFDPQRGSVRAWLTIRARSRALDRLGRETRGARVLGMAAAEATAFTSGAADLEGGHDAAMLRTSLVGLPEDLAQVIEGAYYEGMSAAALADRLAIPVGTVKSRLARALSCLRDRLASPLPTTRVEP